jgi:hypothetical protein
VDDQAQPYSLSVQDELWTILHQSICFTSPRPVGVTPTAGYS